MLPVYLWQELTKFYDTHVNKANIILHEVKKLISLKLHAGDSPTQFISDWRECLQRLEKQGSLLPKDTNTLQALLLLAIQDNTFESIREEILKSPTKDIDVLLSKIRTKDTSMMIKDGTLDLKTDGRRI